MLAAALVLSAFPIYWMFVIATRGNDVVGQVPPPLLPGGDLGDNLERLWATKDANFLLGLTNSAIVASTVTVSVVLLSSLAGFAFAKLRFRGRNPLLVLVLLTMAVPLQQMGIIPLYIMMVKLGWAGELKAVILPFLVNAFGVFFMRQYVEQAIPDELIEAARVDGCSTLRIYWSIVFPALRPAIAVLGLLTFMQTWNEFIWPMVVLTPSNPTVQLSLSALNGAHFQDYTLVFTGTALSTVPLIVIFVLFGRQIVGGIMEGAVK
ncbi:carbohydrate ABC transporter permease [Actinocorallia sp. API 0066]|nr:carbohydrate ABC transporter permease [Actinocorallia sp. API 0066]MCD0453772.1 carbohydrate ABC transporter permease [Actinocorallia sp. API 0066]